MAFPTSHRGKGGVRIVENKNSLQINETPDGHYIFCRYIVKNGRKIFPKRSRAFRIWVSRRERLAK